MESANAVCGNTMAAVLSGMDGTAVTKRWGMTMANGKRLIDANRALEIVHEQGIAHPNAYHLTNYATLILREAPTVDAVEVVRCRNCKYGDWDSEPDDAIVCMRTKDGFWRSGNDFCSYGKRKEDDD